jgi:hypothetical protein
MARSTSQETFILFSGPVDTCRVRRRYTISRLYCSGILMGRDSTARRDEKILILGLEPLQIWNGESCLQ